MNTHFLLELFLYFARFPKKEGVLSLFNKGDSTIQGYAELMDKVNALGEPLLPEIENFVVGPEFDTVRTVVQNFTGFYIFLDYGEIDTSIDRSNRIQDSARMAVTVACRLKSFSGDLMEQLLAVDRCMAYLLEIKNRMRTEQACFPWLKNVSDSHSMSPFSSVELSSIGWSLFFNREEYDLFNMKGL